MATTSTQPDTGLNPRLDTQLNTQPNFGPASTTPQPAYAPGDNFYEALIQAHHGLSDENSRLLNARLILLLANHIGELGVLQEALTAARAGLKQD